MFKNFWTLRVLWITTSALLVLLGAVLIFGFWGLPLIIENQIHKQTQLVKGTEQWDRFEELPFKLNYTIRFWTVKNPYDILYLNQTPILEESKPYTWFLQLSKENITTNDSDDTATYKREFKFEFDDSTDAKDTDVVTIINPILISTLQLSNAIERLPLFGCMDKLYEPYAINEMFLNKSVKEILFDGIIFAENKENIGVACNIVRNRLIKMVDGIRTLEFIEEDDGTSYIRFSIFNYKTKSYRKPSPDGTFTVNRGRDDASMLGNIMLWNGDAHLPTWGNPMSINNDTCNKLRGTDSTIFPPFQEKGGSLDNFNTDICRVVNIKYVSSEEYQGIKGYRYEATNTTFRPETPNPENDCFCSKSTTNVNHEEDCYLDGVFDFKPCVGVPVLVSFPHFLYADEKYIKGVHNMNPDVSKHQMYLLLEPNTGTPLQARIRVQLNVVLRREPFIAQTPENMTETVVPFLWLEESFDLPDKYVDELNDQYFKKVKLANGAKYGGIAVSAALVTISTFFLVRKKFLSRSSPHKTK